MKICFRFVLRAHPIQNENTFSFYIGDKREHVFVRGILFKKT